MGGAGYAYVSEDCKPLNKKQNKKYKEDIKIKYLSQFPTLF